MLPTGSPGREDDPNGVYTAAGSPVASFPSIYSETDQSSRASQTYSQGQTSLMRCAARLPSSAARLSIDARETGPAFIRLTLGAFPLAQDCRGAPGVRGRGGYHLPHPREAHGPVTIAPRRLARFPTTPGVAWWGIWSKRCGHRSHARVRSLNSPNSARSRAAILAPYYWA